MVVTPRRRALVDSGLDGRTVEQRVGVRQADLHGVDAPFDHRAHGGDGVGNGREAGRQVADKSWTTRFGRAVEQALERPRALV